jgi:hypothetical protein
MKSWGAVLLLGMAVGCGASREGRLTAEQAATTERGVREFAQDVARDVTHEGPVAWQSFFEDTPAFFMAVNGQVAFANGAAAQAAIPGIARAIPQIELRWGDDVRVDVLGPDVATLAAPYHEVQSNAAGKRVEENGYFTGTVEKRGGRWKFRNAHWSSAERK